MSKKNDQKYWQGMAKIAHLPLQPKSSPENSLVFLNDAIEFVKKIKGKLKIDAPTETEFYYRWKQLAKKSS